MDPRLADSSNPGRRLSAILMLVAGAALVLSAIGLWSILRGAEDSYPHERVRSLLGPLSMFLLCAAMIVRIRLHRSRRALQVSRVLLGITFAIVLYSFWLLVIVR